MNQELPLILVADDSPDDLFFFRRSIARAKIDNPVMEFGDGTELVNFLERSVDGKRPKITAIFLDIKMPIMGGFEALAGVRANPALERTTVIMLSSSSDERDMARATELGANGYLVKYPDWQTVAAILQRARDILSRPQADGGASDRPMQLTSLPSR